ncbi:hypothetical protein SKAU_G00135190 [Synaphobranchus kaupii]|uniref:Uncharacterized protein n=1 Tax=Synaphobranchus kaupii TaxID=118154 RepID=A0A9Q1FS66_SYNKA|nr:hypothetical protein SKAU_G00135190 [Synaphobranchus kaupii]
MDSADNSQLKSILDRQGVLLGRHQMQLDSLGKTLETFAGSMSNLTAQFQQLQLGREATPSNPVPAPQASVVSVLMDSGADGNQLHLTSIPIQNPLEALAITGAPLVHITHITPPKFAWTSTADKAFQDLKGRFTSAPILIQLDPSR